MNFISRKVLYSLNALLYIASQGRNSKVRVLEVSNALSLSHKYLEMLFVQLKKAGILKSQRGAHGGYFLLKPLKQISLLTLMEIFDGSLQFCEPYDISNAMKSFFDKKNDSLKKELAISLDELYTVQQKGHSVLSYVI